MAEQFDRKINDGIALLLSSAYHEHIVFALAAEFISLMWNAVGRDGDHKVIRKITYVSDNVAQSSFLFIIIIIYFSVSIRFLPTVFRSFSPDDFISDPLNFNALSTTRSVYPWVRLGVWQDVATTKRSTGQRFSPAGCNPTYRCL